jgi:hypothetical protein
MTEGRGVRSAGGAGMSSLILLLPLLTQIPRHPGRSPLWACPWDLEKTE